MIELQKLNKTFHSNDVKVDALSDVDLTIRDGELFGIIGLSGAGKSTLVRCINLLEKPDDGSVVIDGVDITKITQKQLRQVRKNIGMIFQGFNLLEQRNCLSNVCFPLEIIGVKKQQAQERARQLLKIVGLEEKEKAYPSQLSGGQKQRVAIARALATNPKYLLCDEATSALDPNTTDQILQLLKEINTNLGVTIIIITHELSVIEKICDKVAVINNGKIEEYGAVSEVFQNPKSEVAKELILPRKIKNFNRPKKGIRLIFNGEKIAQPILSGLVRECSLNASVLYADINEINQKNYGHMFITFENDDELIVAEDWLNKNNVNFVREE